MSSKMEKNERHNQDDEEQHMEDGRDEHKWHIKLIILPQSTY